MSFDDDRTSLGGSGVACYPRRRLQQVFGCLESVARARHETASYNAKLVLLVLLEKGSTDGLPQTSGSTRYDQKCAVVHSNGVVNQERKIDFKREGIVCIT
eukprot:scaffold407_cov168-Amphora_coffeaeformis.AAC.10